MTFDGMKLRIRNGYIRATANRRVKKLHKEDFTIISNNCWGGLVYESYGIEKQSPTMGMFFMADEYIKFITNLEYYLQCEMTFIDPEESRHKNYYKLDSRFGSYPIARLADVEIALLHFHSNEDAKDKWERRCKRIKWDHLLIKMNDQNECTIDHLNRFMQLSYSHKLFFTVRDDFKSAYQELDIVCRVKSKKKDCCGLFDEPFGSSVLIDINEIINEL